MICFNGRSARGLIATSLALVIMVGASAQAQGVDKPAKLSPSRGALALVAPVLPASVVALMQEGKYTEAIVGLDRLIADSKEVGHRSYFALIRGTAQRLSGKPELAKATWAQAIQVDPQGHWAPKIRFELAGIELQAGRTAAAEELARVEAERLLGSDRKDRLAEVYYAFARHLLKPDDPITPTDPNGAYALLVQAYGLAKGPVLRARLALDQARAAQATGNFPQAINHYQAYLKEPKATERPAALFAIGECQFDLVQLPSARLTWTDLASELDKPPGRDRADASEIRAKALYKIARTHGFPNPPDDTQLNLGVAALKRFLSSFPDHPWSVKASYEIGAAYLARGRSDAAIASLTSFLKGDDFKATSDEAKRDLASLSTTATYQIAQILQGQQRFDDAITAYQGYLTKYPNGAQSADAQRAILDTKLLIAADALAREKYGDARSAWLGFVTSNPLDPRVPQILFQVGESFVTANQPNEAMTAWETLLSKFPESEPAAHAQYLTAMIYETQKGDLAGAIDRFKAIAVEPWLTGAKHRIAVMESRQLTVVTPRAFRSGETPHLKISTRNLETLTFTVYKLNADAYFRKKQALGKVESLDVSLVAADAEWTVPVANYGKYKPVETTYDLKVKAPGVWVVKVTDEKHLQATTLVLGSDLDAIVKTSRTQLLIFAQDMKTGKGRPNARVLVSDGTDVILEKKTGADGVLITDWDKPREANSGLQYLVLDGDDIAGTGLGVPSQVAQGLSARAYIYTDRPAYRPGQEVALRGVIREIKAGQYANPAGQVYKLEVFDSRGRVLIGSPVTLSSYGTFHETLRLDNAAPVGSYRVRLSQPGKSEFAGAFEVQSYRLEKIDLDFDLPKTVYYRGEKVSADVIAKYQYGAPVAGRTIQVALPDGRTLTGLTDGSGKYHVEFSTAGFAEEQTLRIEARLPQDNVAAVADVALAIRGFRIDVSTLRTVYLDGESFAVKVNTVDAQGKPIGQDLSLAVLKRIEQNGRVTERGTTDRKLNTEAKTGDASIPVKVDDADGGNYIIRVSGTDKFGNVVFTDRVVTISGQKDQIRLRILTDRLTYKVGETATVNIHSRVASGPSLVAWEADRVLQYRLIDLKEGESTLTWAVEGAQFPNFTLTAARMSGSRFDEAKLDVRVDRDLRVTLTPKKAAVGPGELVEVDITTVDQTGKPVAAEVSVALVDQSLLRLHADSMPAIGPYFYNQTRTGAFATAGSNTFRYDPSTTPVSEALIEEAARLEALTQNDAKRGLAVIDGKRLADHSYANRAGDKLAQDFALPAPAPAMTASAPEAPPANAPQEAAKGMFFSRQGGLVAGGNGAVALSKKKDWDGLARDDDRKAGRIMARTRAGASALGAMDLAGADAEPNPRQRFVETAYWNPSVVTNADGKVSLTFKAPTALSEYHFTARGVSGGETLVGQSSSDLIVKKDFFVDLKTPSILSQGDRPRFSGEIHHMGLTGTVTISLTAYAGGKEVVYPKTLVLKGDGIDEVNFDPFEVPEGDVVRLTLRAQVGKAIDELTAEVPIRPWGVQAYASASGTSSNDTTVFVELPPGRTYENPEMLVTVSPTLRRLIVELALGLDDSSHRFNTAIRIAPCPILPLTIADRAGDLIAASAALSYLRTTKADAAPEALRLTSRIQGLVSELITLQNDDGGWPWVASTGDVKHTSDRMTSALAAHAFHAAWEQAMMVDSGAFDRAANYLAQQQAQIDAGDLEMRAMIQHSLASLHKGSFESANALNRVRQTLPDAALAELALTLAALDRAALANEVLDILATRAKTEPGEPGQKPHKYWLGANQHWHNGPAETTALVASAFAQIRPKSSELQASVEWLLAHRSGAGWQPHKANAAAVAALASYYQQGATADDHYRLVVTVNGTEVDHADVTGATLGRSVNVPQKALKIGDKNRVRFSIEGRGTYGYTVSLTGFARDFRPEQSRADKLYGVDSREVLAADPELDGKTLPTGFAAVINPKPFQNKVTQVGLGGRARVEVQTSWYYRGDRPSWERDFLIVEETLPAGTTLIEGSLQSQAQSHSLADGVLTLYFAPGTYPGTIRYDVFGNLPGQYRVAPTVIRSAYDPARSHLGPAGELRILSPGESGNDPYKATPDELYARGVGLFDLGRFAEAAGPLEELFGGYTLKDEVLKDVARRLLTIHIKDYQPRKIVQDFEVLKEKAPELIIAFDEVAVVGRAYRDIGEHERAYLVWRAIVEASYLEDAQVGEVLRQKGKSLDAIAYLIDLWRDYPNTASIEADFFGLSQLLAVTASKAITDPRIRQEAAEAGVTRSELLLQTIRLIQVLIAQSPKTPLADEASLALVGAFLELEDFESVVKLSGRFAGLYPKSHFLDSFQYSEALGRFNLGDYDRAVEVAEKIRKATYKDANGIEQPSPNKWEAVYILGQIYDARQRPEQAVAYYKEVADRFTDAAGAIKGLTRKDLKLPEVSIIRPGVNLAEKSTVPLNYRNIAEADVKVYPVDLMRLYLTRRNLDAIAGIDLAGITPLYETTIPLGDGKDFGDKIKSIELPLTKEGAYLVMIRGETLYASGIILVSPLEVEVLEDPESGRARVTVRDAKTKAPASKVNVKVIGTENPNFVTGQTDLRGVFVAENLRGQVTAVARTNAAQYAFYRGKSRVGAPPAPAKTDPDQASDAPAPNASTDLSKSLRKTNNDAQNKQVERLESRYKSGRQGIKAQEAK